jgi:hypothetical protein
MSTWKKIWDFLWKSNSVWSWIADFILVFLLVKFIIFPVFGLVFGTSLPFVIIESGSLEHKIVSYDSAIPPGICGSFFNESKDISSDFNLYWQYCGSWYEEHNITRAEFEQWRWQRGMNKGDIIIVKGLKNRDYKKGDIIIFRRIEQQYKTPIIHRVIDVKDGIFSTKGDHNGGQLDYEKEISQEQVVGRAIARIPKLGWVKLFFVELFR